MNYNTLSIDPSKINDKTIFISGGTGSFGKKMIETLLKNFNPCRIIVYSRDEYKQSLLKVMFPPDKHTCMRFLIGDIRDYDRLEIALNGVDLVFHACALKRIGECEYNPMEAVKTNVLGTNNMVRAAIKNRVPVVIGISTDKACSPANLYGATKLCAEKILVNGNILSKGLTKFSVVRYGNVLGSRGSCLEIFHKLKQQGKPITVTSMDMTRFTITLQEAIHFVLMCLDICIGGEIYIPLLPSYKIGQMLEIFDSTDNYEVIGIRKGEKLHELMVSADESHMAYKFKKFIILTPLEEFNIQHFNFDGLHESYEEMGENNPYSSGNNILISNEQLKKLAAELLETYD